MTAGIPGRCDVLIRGGEIIDGTGAPRRRGDVAIRGDRIVALGDLDGVEADATIERTRLLAALKPYLNQRQMDTDWASLQDAPVEALVSALAMICPFEPAEKQALLESPATRERAEALIALLEMANAAALPGAPSTHPLN